MNTNKQRKEKVIQKILDLSDEVLLGKSENEAIRSISRFISDH